MIESLSISNVATFGDKPEILFGLSKFNFIFGPNGAGKTTISRVIAEPDKYKHCQITWANGTSTQTLVYNRDFIDDNFNQSSEIKGVFTLGEENIETLDRISTERAEQRNLQNDIQTLQNTLSGEDGTGGKIGDLKALEESFKNKCWSQKQKYDDRLKGAFEGYRNNAENFKNKVIEEFTSNVANLVTLDDLVKRAETIFGQTPSKEILIDSINASHLINLEENPVLRKRVLGKSDVDISGMINKLGNSDWVRQGRIFYEVNQGSCPFCQKDTDDSFAKSLAEYFDESFEKDSKAIDELIVNYKSYAARLQQKIAEIISKSYRFLNIEKLKLEKQLLDSLIAGNLQKLASKKNEPSQLVDLDPIADITNAINILIDDANAGITQNNNLVDNLSQERNTLTKQVWKFLLEELKTDLSDYSSKKMELNAAIESISNKINAKTIENKIKDQEIIELERQTTSIQPTIDAINGMLKSFGFYGFSLASAVDNLHYRLARPDGSEAKDTLSEGERTFITFLYFYHLLKGSNSANAITDNRIVVFDDPVSSLDSDILFIVSSLIRELFDDIRSGNSYIKQIFVLTHNVYFHKEISYNQKRLSDKVLNEESFWIVRKNDLLSKVSKQNSNPIKTSYELLWVNIREASVSSQVTIQNIMRRILEHYFKILGGINLDDIYKNFHGKDKIVCKSLLSWVHDGSHSVSDDLYISIDDITVENYLRLFKEIFQKSGHISHYNMMMGEDLQVTSA